VKRAPAFLALLATPLLLAAVPMTLEIRSPSFADGGAIPSPYTCDGRNGSPELDFSGVPGGAKSLALICDDPDAPSGLWVHWVIFDLPPSTAKLPESVPTNAKPPAGGVQGKNDFGKLGYGGPCPPSGTHRYEFKLYALDSELKLPAGASKAQVVAAMQGHVVAEAKLTGKYKRG
jgi:Raf kinase inhibitor-like YbhB/YbcL family protein